MKYLKEWTPEDFKKVEGAIKKHFAGRTMLSQNRGVVNFPRSYTGIADDILGVAYTSTGICAGYWICNVQLYFDVKKLWWYVGFVINESGAVCCWIEDENEKDIIFEL